MTTLKYLFSNYIMYNDVKQQTGCCAGLGDCFAGNISGEERVEWLVLC